MIALGCAAALAGPLEVDLSASVGQVGTPGLVAHQAGTDVWGQPVRERLPPEQIPLQPALSLDLLPGPIGDTEWLISFGGGWERRAWDLPNLAFRPTVVEGRALVGLRAFFDALGDEPTTDGFGRVAAGLQVSGLSAAPFARALAPAMVTELGLGITGRRAPTRLRAELRGELVLRLDRLRGTAALPTSTFEWTWWPGSAGLSLWVGGGRDGRRAGAPAPAAARSPLPPEAPAG